jgi:hypothetical protein
MSWKRAPASSIRAGDVIKVKGIFRPRTITVTEVEQHPGRPVRIVQPGGRTTHLQPGAQVEVGPRKPGRSINNPRK